ncbi:MAG: hypothetical protein KME05_02345 [Gloeocapsa sp. UFS-A4-WI-NPMV-4B04]|nr:hypothetical protein [Gloeocapsa sp. UFS-A4-WI-NPMV-4B04]
MPNSQNPADTSNTTVTKLLEADAFLATQETHLSAQLQSLQEKRHSLKTVIDLFTLTDTATATPIATPPETPVAEAEAEVSDEQAELPAQDVVTPELDTSKTDTTDNVEAQALPATQKRQAKKNSASASKKQSAKSKSQNPNKEQETWQQYLREEFSNATLATAVSEVMQRQPEQVLNAAAIVDAIFVNEIPHKVLSKARELVSNILSVGVKKEKWYRGEVGSYSVSKAAVENSAT